jgi:hypothetical protein
MIQQQTISMVENHTQQLTTKVSTSGRRLILPYWALRPGLDADFFNQNQTDLD